MSASISGEFVIEDVQSFKCEKNDNIIFLENKIFILTKDKKEYRIEIIKSNDKISFKCLNYSLKLSLEDLQSRSILFKICQSLDEAYLLIINSFNKKNVQIQNITNQMILLLFKITSYIDDKEKNFPIALLYNNKNNDLFQTQIYNNFNLLKKEVISLKEKLKTILTELDKIKKENQTMKQNIKFLMSFQNNERTDRKLIENKSYQNFIQLKNDNTQTKNTSDSKNKDIRIRYKSKHSKLQHSNIKKSTDEAVNTKNSSNQIIRRINININNFNESNSFIDINNSTPIKNLKIKNIKLLKNVTSDSYCIDYLDNTFELFNIKNTKKIYLVYATAKNSIKCYNLEEKNITLIKEIIKAHDDYITNFRHIYNNNLKVDILMSISGNNQIKIWNCDNWNCILELNNINKSGMLYSACFLFDENNYYIISSNRDTYDPEFMKIFDFNGKKIKEIKNSNKSTYFIEIFYDNSIMKNYIITGNQNFIRSYDYDENKVYYTYSDNKNNDNNKNYNHFSIVMNISEGIIKMLESCEDNFIRVWNFHKGNLINKINCNTGLIGICLINENYLCIGCMDKTIKFVDLEKGVIGKLSTDYGKSFICTIKKFVHPVFGECLISQGWHDEQIKIWINKN